MRLNEPPPRCARSWDESVPENVRVALGEVAQVTVGHVGPMASEYVDEGVPFLRSLNVRPHRIDPTDLKYVSPDFHATLRKSALASGDVVTVRTGKPGQTAVVPDWLDGANCSDLVITRPGPRLDAHWFSYYMNWITYTQISGHLVGAVQQHFNIRAAQSLLLDLPEIVEQRAIAEVLGALDDKIAANAQTVRVLLDLADAHFAYAVREAQVGSASFNDLALVGGGGTPRTSVEEYWGGGIAWATPTDVTALSAPYLERTSRTVTEDGLAVCASVLYPKGSILMTSRATIGAFAIA